MEPPEKPPKKERNFDNLQQELNDLRQGLATVTDVYRDLECLTKRREAGTVLDKTIVKPLEEEDREFEAIWEFHEAVLDTDPDTEISREAMFDAFVEFCTKSGQSVIDEDAFTFMLTLMENPRPVLVEGQWKGCRLRVSPD